MGATDVNGEGPKLESRLDNLYARRFPDAERRAKARLWRILCDAFFSRYVPEDGCVLDLGAGYCEFINNVRARRRIAVDVNPATAEYAAPGIEVHRVALASVASVVAPESVDLAFASNVLEHMRDPDALLAVLSAVRTVLKPRGRLLIMQPNVRHVGAAFWDFFNHTLPLTEKGMEEALGVAGLTVREVRSASCRTRRRARCPSGRCSSEPVPRHPPAPMGARLSECSCSPSGRDAEDGKLRTLRQSAPKNRRRRTRSC